MPKMGDYSQNIPRIINDDSKPVKYLKLPQH